MRTLGVIPLSLSLLSAVKNDDGTTSMVTVVPGFGGLSFVIGAKEGCRTLTLRDAQHEYLFSENKEKAAK